MFRVLIILIALTDIACAQIVKPDENLQEQIVPESFAFTGTATARKFNSFWRTSVSYTVVNKSGINLYLGLMQNGVSLGSCGDAESTQSGLPLLPSPSASVYSSPAGGLPRAVFVPASGRTSRRIVLENCAAPNPGFETAPLSITLMLGKTNDWKKMITLPVDAEIPIRQLAEE